MVSRVLLVCLALLVLKAHQERMVTRSDSRTHLSYPATSIFPQHFLLHLDNSIVACFTTSHCCYFGVNADVLFFQGEVGEHGQKGSKGDKGEQVSTYDVYLYMFFEI